MGRLGDWERALEGWKDGRVEGWDPSALSGQGLDGWWFVFRSRLWLVAKAPGKFSRIAGPLRR